MGSALLSRCRTRSEPGAGIPRQVYLTLAPIHPGPTNQAGLDTYNERSRPNLLINLHNSYLLFMPLALRNS